MSLFRAARYATAWALLRRAWRSSRRSSGAARHAISWALLLAPVAAVAAGPRDDYPVDVDEALGKKSHPHFEFWSQKKLDRQQLYALFRNLDEVRRDVGRDLDIFPEEKFQIVLTPDDVFRDYSGQGSHVAGLFDGKIHIPIPQGSGDDRRLQSVLWHEYTHAVVWTATRGHCPRWLNEGLAEYEEATVDPTEKAGLAGLLGSRGKLPYSWDELESVFRTGSVARARLGYLQASAVAHTLFDRYGRRRVGELLVEVGRRGGDFPAAAKAILNTDPERLEREVVRHVERLR